MSTSTCVRCAHRIDERRETYWNSIEAWEKKRASAGSNHVVMKKQTGKAICNACMDRLLAGVSAGQESLL